MSADGSLLAKYANWFNIGHNNFEFVLELGQFHPTDRAPTVHTRIVVGPVYAKALATLLNESLENTKRCSGRFPTPETRSDNNLAGG